MKRDVVAAAPKVAKISRLVLLHAHQLSLFRFIAAFPSRFLLYGARLFYRASRTALLPLS
jgi:hypothetical protein